MVFIDEYDVFNRLDGAINHTYTVLDQYSSGDLLFEDVYLVWQLGMTALGLFPEGGGDDQPTEEQFTNENVVEVLLDYIIELTQQQTELLVSKIDQQTQNILAFTNESVNTILQTSNQQASQLYDLVQATQQNVLEGTQNLISTTNQTIFELSQANAMQIDSVLQRTEQLELETTGNILSAINDSTQQTVEVLTQQIQNIQQSPDGGSGGAMSAWTEGYIVDLLNMLDTNLRNIVTELSGIQTNPDGTGGTGQDGTGQDGTDSSGSIGFDVLGLTAIQEFLDTLSSDSAEENAGNFEQNLDLIQQLGTGQFNSVQEMQDFLIGQGFGGTLAQLSIDILGNLALLIGIGGALSSPYLANVETLSRTDALPTLLPITQLLELRIRKLITEDEYYQKGAKLGFTQERLDNFVLAGTVQLPEIYLREAFLRELITENQFKEGMVRLGFLAQDLDTVVDTLVRPPSVQDAIQFAVREVYSDDIAEQLQLDKNYELVKDQFERVLKHNGIDPDQGQNYWRAHWRLPSPSQAYEIFWRTDRDKDWLRRFLEIADYAPDLIDDMIEIAYKPYTRVDVRRMHKLGILDDEGVKRAYLDLGYNDERAEGLLQFTKELNGRTESEALINLTTSQILRGMVNGLIPQTEAKSQLEQTGLTDSEADLIIQNAFIAYQSDILGDVTRDNRGRIIRKVSSGYIDGILPESYVRQVLGTIGYDAQSIEEEIQFLGYEREIAIVEQQNDMLLNSFIKYQTTISEVGAELAQRGFSASEQSQIQQLWIAVREDRKTLPTKAEAGKFYGADLITEEEYLNILRGRGVPEKYLSAYLAIL